MPFKNKTKGLLNIPRILNHSSVTSPSLKELYDFETLLVIYTKNYETWPGIGLIMYHLLTDLNG